MQEWWISAAGESCKLDVTVQVAAGATAAVTDTATISVTGATPTASVSLTATPVLPAHLALYGITGNIAPATPTNNGQLEFGAVPINSTAVNGSGVVTITFTNTGGLPATGISSTLQETNADASTDGFSLVSESPGTCSALPSNQLLPGATCTVRLRLRPSTIGQKNATFNLTGISIASVNVYLHGSAIANPPSSVYATVVGSTDSVYAFPSTAASASPGSVVYFDLHNPTGANLASATIAALGGNTADFVVASGATGSGTACAQAGDGTFTVSTAGCQIKVTFVPTGTWDATTRYRWSAVGLNLAPIAGLIGQAQQPAQLQIAAATSATATIVNNASTQSVDFGQVLEGGTPSVTFTIKNIGEGPTVGAVQGTLTNASYATASAPCGALAANATCTVTVSLLGSLATGLDYTAGTFQATDPSAAGESSAEVFHLMARVVSVAVLKLTGPTSLSFGTTPVGVAVAPITLTVSNGNPGDTSVNRQDTGSVSLALSDNTNFKLDYGTADGTCGALPVLADGGFVLKTGAESCTVTVTFDPKSVGALQTNVTVSSKTGTPGGAANLTLTGTGQGDLVVTSTNPTNGGRIVVTDTVDLIFTNNNHTDSTNLLRTTLAGTNAAAFAVVFDSCYGQLLDAGASCTVTVVFTGTSSATTAQTADVTVSDGSATTTNNTATALLKVGGPST